MTKREQTEILDDLTQTVDLFNMTLEATKSLGELPEANPEIGNVIFGSAAQGWAFTIPQLAEVYAKKQGIDIAAMSKRMWGDTYFNPATKKWSKNAAEGSVRAFIQLVLNPFAKVLEACETGNMELLDKMMKGVGVTLAQSGDRSETQFAITHVTPQAPPPRV